MKKGLRSAEAGSFYFPSKLRNTGQHQVPMGHGKRGTAAKYDFRLWGLVERDIFFACRKCVGRGPWGLFCLVRASNTHWLPAHSEQTAMGSSNAKAPKGQGAYEKNSEFTRYNRSGVRYESVRPPAECPAACLRALRGRPHQAHIARSRCGARRASESTGAAGSSSQFASRVVRCGASALPPSPATDVASKW